MRKYLLTICCLLFIYTSGCVNDTEKHSESAVNPETQDTVPKIKRSPKKTIKGVDTTNNKGNIPTKNNGSQ